MTLASRTRTPAAEGPAPQPVAPELRPVTSLAGVGESLAARLERLNVRAVQDLWFLLPLRYEDRTRVRPIGELTEGARAAVEATVELSEIVFRGRRQLLCRVTDGSGWLTLRFFHFNANQQAGLARGTKLRLYGEVRRGPAGLEIVHPEYRRVDRSDPLPVDQALTPIYPTTEGLQQGRLRTLTAQALTILGTAQARDWLPEAVTSELGLPSLTEALRFVHRPPPSADLDELARRRHPAQRRLAFEELLAHHLSLRELRREVEREVAWPLADAKLAARLLATLPFKLTPAQQRVSAEIDRDLERERPMLRLIQGDVGSGKTIVAALAVARAVGSGRQVTVMAPTELLAEQHLQNFARWFTPLKQPVALLTGKVTGRPRRTLLAAIASGDVPIVVGTHALFQEGVDFARLALVVIDEQHRFGVEQRRRLRAKGEREQRFAHQLIMTATPIPRTLAMTAYADLDVSVIDELPPGRTPIKTVALPQSRRDEVVARIDHACAEGRQVYWVCPLIEESETLEQQAAEEMAAQLAEALPRVRVGLIHGRMPPRQKEATMQRFKAGEIQLLVATTVIEVGVDVPNASLMVIDNAERMGLAQLHQLRGRVGRGTAESTCVLLYRPPLSELAHERLGVLRATNDGFEVARKDLELRGPGELLGTRQTGLMEMRVADLLRDADLLPRVQRAAELMQSGYPDNIAPLLRRWIGVGSEYGKVG
jgi:ATP-dependent DNA helicase RecG